MELTEILDRLERLLTVESDRLKNDKEDVGYAGFVKEALILVFQLLITLLKPPFRFVAGYVKNEVFYAVKRDSRLMAVIAVMLLVLLVFFVVFWMSLSVAAGVYFYEKGNTLFVSVLYSLVFQFISSIITALIAYFSFRKLKSFKVYKSILRKN
jgi:hypothetical protein